MKAPDKITRQNKGKAIANITSPRQPDANGLADNRPEIVAQRKLQAMADARAIAQSSRPVVQKVEGTGSQDDPYKIYERESQTLMGQDMDDHLIIPNVSGCAGIKLNVFSNDPTEGESLAATIAFHSDGTEVSQGTARAIGNDIAGLNYPGKRVRIIVITNKKQFDSFGEHMTNVISIITAKLAKAGIPTEVTHKALVRNVGNTVDIDLTGSEADIKNRYRKHYKFTKDELRLKSAYAKEYKPLLLEARDLKIFQKNLRKGRGMVANPNYMKEVSLGEFAKLEPDDAKQVLDELRTKVETAKGGCFITTACVRNRGLSDDCDELTVLRHFRDTYVAAIHGGKDMIAAYYRLTPLIVANIDKSPDAKQVYDSLFATITLCVTLIRQKKFRETMDIYKQMVFDLAREYCPG